MKPSDYLRKGWCQGYSARTGSGQICKADSPDAVAWCAYGSIEAAYPEDVKTMEDCVTRLKARLMQLTKDTRVASWNDDPGRKQQEVIDLLESIGE